jgi:nucleotide-binding universal stress UspA family protein
VHPRVNRHELGFAPPSLLDRPCEREPRTLGAVDADHDAAAHEPIAICFVFDRTRIQSPTFPPVDESIVEADRKVAAEQLESVVSGSNAEGVEIERLLVEGPAAAALIENEKGADLLVVGTCGHGGFTGLLLGSVRQQCAQHGPRPVVIVRPADETIRPLERR